MTKEMNRNVSDTSSLIGLPLSRRRRDSVRGPVLYLASPSSFFFPKGRSGASLQFRALIASNSAVEYIQTEKNLITKFSASGGGQGAYSPL